jgi:hypothetical protein
MSHHPIVEVLSSETVDDIPFIGQRLDYETASESRPNVIRHSSGRFCQIFPFGSGFKYVFTDEDRTMFYHVQIPLPSSHVPVEASLCELSDGSGNIGVVYIAVYASSYRVIRSLVISPEGENVVDDAVILNGQYTSGVHLIDSPFVIVLQGSFAWKYFMVYYHKTISGATYRIQKRTSVDFVAWSVESECSIGLTTANPRYNPFLLQLLDSDDVMLFFDYRQATSGGAELTNIYHLTSSNGGSSWSSGAYATTYAGYDAVAKHPFAVQKQPDRMHLMYQETMGALRMDKDTPGWCGSSYLAPTDGSIDPTERMMYVVSKNSITGVFQGIIEINLDTWAIERCWNCATSPGFNAIFCNFTLGGRRNHGGAFRIPIGTVNSLSAASAAVLNAHESTITQYHFRSNGTYSVTANVGLALDSDEYLGFTWIDDLTNRLYFLFHTSSSIRHQIRLGYIELNEIPSGLYTWHSVIVDSAQLTLYEVLSLTSYGDFLVDPSTNYIVVSMGHGQLSSSYVGKLKIYTMDGLEHKSYTKANHDEFPYHGLKRCAIIGNKIYGTFIYEALYGEDNKFGLCEINVDTDQILFHHPTWATLTDYKLGEITATSDGRLIMLAYGYGITIFDPSDNSWLLYNNANVPGMTKYAENNFRNLVLYDEEDGWIATGQSSSGDMWNGLTMISEYGVFKQVHYTVGELNGSWDFGVSPATPLVSGFVDYDLAAVLDPTDDTIFAFWVRDVGAKTFVYWDKEVSEFDLTPYITNTDDISIKRSIDGSPARLEFAVSHGHLFDPTNLSSLWSIYLKKFRELNVKFGERVDGDPVLQQQGIFIVRENSRRYRRPEYPVMGIVAEDRSCFWERANVTATPPYDTTPKLIIEDVLGTFAGLSVVDDCDIPNFDDSITLFHQWVESNVKDIVDQVCERFGYFPTIDVDGKVTARKISDSNPIDPLQVYLGTSKQIEFTPDDSYSDFTNRVIVIGEGRSFIEVLFGEEMVAELHKTVGWWGHKESHDVWYSDDGSRRCRYPRLEIIESVKNFNFKLGGGREYISGVDPAERYCIVRIESPDLVAWLIVAIVLYIVLRSIADVVGWFGSVCGIASSILLSIIITTVASLANCEYRIHAQPVGYVRQSFQGMAQDIDLQRIAGMVIEVKIQDPFCYTFEHCQKVATQEMLVARLQRNRFHLSKPAHLQDEIGDTISFEHPYSELTMKAFITDLTRSFKKGASGDGYFLDTIEGWIL